MAGNGKFDDRFETSFPANDVLFRARVNHRRREALRCHFMSLLEYPDFSFV